MKNQVRVWGATRAGRFQVQCSKCQQVLLKGSLLTSCSSGAGRAGVEGSYCPVPLQNWALLPPDNPLQGVQLPYWV